MRIIKGLKLHDIVLQKITMVQSFLNSKLYLIKNEFYLNFHLFKLNIKVIFLFLCFFIVVFKLYIVDKN